MDLSQMRKWPERSSAAPEATAPEPVEYADNSIGGLAERCATHSAEWGGPEKLAAKSNPAALWRDPRAHPLVLTMMTLDRYGDESMEWDPEVVRATLIRDSISVSGANWTKMLAVRTLISSPSPWRQWEVFHWVSLGLSGQPPNFSFLETPEIEFMFVCADIMKICDPSRKTSDEVDRFTAAALRHEGHVVAPESLDFAQRSLDDPHFECPTCSARFPDTGDIRCISCGAQTLKAAPHPFGELKQEFLTLWKPRVRLPLERAVQGLPQTPAGNLVQDMLARWDHAVSVRHQLRVQLRELAG